MGFAFLGDAEGVVAGEVDKPLAWDDFKVMGVADAEPAAGDHAADGFVFVAEDGFHFLWCDDVGAFAENVLQPFIFSSVVIV